MKNTKKLLSVILVLCLLLTSGIIAFAELDLEPDYENVKATRLVNVPDNTYDNKTCTAIGGIGVKNGVNNKEEMYTVKVYSSNDSVATFYYYPDKEDLTECNIFKLYNAGHANGITVDANNVYIAARKYSNVNGDINKIIQIPRSYIRGLTDGATMTEAINNSQGYKILYPKIANPDPNTSATTPYIDYTYAIGSITRHYDDGRFIIRAEIPGKSSNDHDYAFTRASIKTINGKEEFVVSDNEDHIFFIKNVINYNYGNQDICYSETNGFFLPKSHYEDAARNVILWANIKGGNNDTTKTVGTKVYRCYTPKVILFDRTGDQVNGERRFSKYEVESCAVDSDKELILSVNVEYRQDYVDEIGGTTPAKDRIIQLNRGTNGKFTLDVFNS